MIIVKLKGGLGNQLFQYAMGRSLSLRKNTIMKIDAFSAFKNDVYKRKYALWCFNILENFASEDEIARFNKAGIRRYTYKILSKFVPYYKRPIIEEQEKFQFCFDQNLLRIPNNVYLDGYWQNENYFCDIADIIRNEFTFKLPIDPLNQVIAEKIIDTESVSIHLRRLHGMSHDRKNILPESVNFHGVSSLDYYKMAIKKITKIVNKPHFFIFSDDYDWAEKNLKLDYPATYINYNSVIKDYEDFHLMTLCRHHIIANSSFSWWGAWLSKNNEKIVFAPKYWDTRNLFFKDLTPEYWQRI